MKIVNINKFLRGIALIIGLSIIFALFINNSVTLSHKELSYREIYTMQGDTLWELAKEEAKTNLYYKDKDIRYIVKDLKKVNNLSTSEIATGQKILIPNI